VVALAAAGRRLARIAPPAQDALLAAGLAVVAQIETWGSAAFTAKFPMALLAVTITVPIAWRRRAPVVVLVVGLLFGLVFGSLWPTVDPIYQIIALIVACYSLGAYGSFAAGLASVVVVVCIYLTGAVLDDIQDTGQHGPGDVGMLAFLVVGAWLLGRRVERRSGEATEMAKRAEQLERERERQEADILARERARIARELHDVIAHSVSVMVIQAGAAEQLLDSDPPRAREPLVAVQELGRSTVDELRRMLGILRDHEHEPSLNPQPGMAGLPHLIRQFREAGLPVEMRVEGDPVPLRPGIDLSAYRIVQEALTNTLKHAKPAAARVLVRYSGAVLELEVVDDGAPASPGNGQGHGLVGMRERASLYGGVLTTGPRPGGGYGVRASLPVGGDRQ
jgi:signal transduction histidine kinase